MQTLLIYKLGLNQKYNTFTLILIINIVVCCKFPCTKFINNNCFEMRWHDTWTSRCARTPPSLAHPSRRASTPSTAC